MLEEEGRVIQNRVRSPRSMDIFQNGTLLWFQPQMTLWSRSMVLSVGEERSMGMRRAPGGGEGRDMVVAAVVVEEVIAGDVVEEEEEEVDTDEVCKGVGAEDGEEEVDRAVGGEVDEEVDEPGGKEEVEGAEYEKVRMAEVEIGEEEEEVFGRSVVSMVVWLSSPPVPEADVRIVSFCNCRV